MSFLRQFDITLRDRQGHYADIDFMGQLLSAQPYRVVGSRFTGATIDTNFWNATTSGAGAANTQVTNKVTTASGTANNGYANVRSVRIGRFIFAHPMLFRSVVRIPTVVVALNTRRWGVFTLGVAPAVADGFYFELSAAGVLSVNRANTGVVTTVASGAFNGAISSYVVDTNVHAYEIAYFAMRVDFMVDGVILHTFTPTTTSLVDDYSLPVTWTSVNGAAGVTSGTIEMWDLSILRIGRDLTHPTSVRQAGVTAGLVLKRGPGQLHSIIISNDTGGATATIYDNTAASGTVLWSSPPMAGGIVPLTIDLRGIQFQIGLTLVVTGAANNVIVVFE